MSLHVITCIGTDTEILHVHLHVPVKILSAKIMSLVIYMYISNSL